MNEIPDFTVFYNPVVIIVKMGENKLQYSLYSYIPNSICKSIYCAVFHVIGWLNSWLFSAENALMCEVFLLLASSISEGHFCFIDVRNEFENPLLLHWSKNGT
jgi:hypothetical protein